MTWNDNDPEEPANAPYPGVPGGGSPGIPATGTGDSEDWRAKVADAEPERLARVAEQRLVLLNRATSQFAALTAELAERTNENATLFERIRVLETTANDRVYDAENRAQRKYAAACTDHAQEEADARMDGFLEGFDEGFRRARSLAEEGR
mgnify:CR=1 FL=1